MGALKKIIILPGWSKNIQSWRQFISFIEDQNTKVELLRIPGLTTKIDKPWTLGDYLTWLKEIVDKENRKVILLGHSNGGRVSSEFVSRYPQKIEKLILIDSAGVYHNELPVRAKRLFFKTLGSLGKKFTKSEVLRKALYKLARENDYFEASPIMQKTMINLLLSDKNHDFSKISVPTLIVWGGQDKITPLSDAKIIRTLIKNSKLSVIDSARHSPQFTRANEVAKVIKNFIANE